MVLAVVVLILLTLWAFPVVTVLPLAILAAIFLFFRNPDRTVPDDPLAIVSAADGRVISVEETEDVHFTQEKMRRVAVFLSVLDVHVNRSPVNGRLEKLHHHAGDFLDARDPEVDVKNEAVNWLIQTDRGPVVMRQLAGLIARRIVAWSAPGEVLARGARVGLIKFGSRTDLYLPLDCEVLVRAGDRVKGGETVIARWPKGGN